MTLRPPLPFALWTAAIVLAASAVGAVRSGAAPLRMQFESSEDAVPMKRPPAVDPQSVLHAAVDPEQIRAAAAVLRDRNPFRVARTPTELAFTIWTPAEPAAPEMVLAEQEAAEPRLPALSMGGVVGGPPWKALIEGLGDHGQGVLLAVGEERNGVRVEWIDRESVRLATSDTTWVLPLKRPWR